MSGALCALWIGLVSIATVCSIGPCPSLAAFLMGEGAIPSWLFRSNLSQLNFERWAASPGGAPAALFQLAVRWGYPPSSIMAGRVRAPHTPLLNSESSARQPWTICAVVENP